MDLLGTWIWMLFGLEKHSKTVLNTMTIKQRNAYAERQRILSAGRGPATSGREIRLGVRGSTKHPIGLQSAIGVFKIGSGFPCTPLYIAWKPGNFGFTRLSP